MILRILLLIILFLILVWIMGKLFLSIIHGEEHDAGFIGFFVYFSGFQILALPMIIALRPLSWLSAAWGISVIGCSIVAIVCYKPYKTSKISSCIRSFREKFCEKYLSLEGIMMFLFVVLQTYIMLVQNRQGWDSAYYNSNVNTSIYTNSMYLYEGSIGRPEIMLNLRYAMSSFYMHDAVLGQIFGIPGTIICRYFNVAVCSIFSAYIVYKIGQFLFQETKWAQLTVAFWILANLGMRTIYLPNDFLLYRSNEAKSYCCNIVIPAIIYVILKLYKEPDNKMYWKWLFVINFASVAISESSMLLVPVLNGCMLSGYFIIEKKWRNLGKGIICMLPSICYLLIYLLSRLDIFTIRITA